MKTIKIFETNKPDFSIAWYDIWIGVFIDQEKRRLYICPLPCLLFTISLDKK
ncbi:MAG TPA: hypothetical protein P5232_01310 [Candidatus Moranbacteria bacterium]|nr:hypothetical protein [Candidatus Moranbacteria bacterium]